MRTLFVHIPKTGGMTLRKAPQLRARIIVANRGNHVSPEYTETVRQVMQAAGEHEGFEHARWRDFRQDLRDKCPAVAIVRNPWGRTVSRYTFAVLREAYRGTFREFLEQRHKYGGRPYYWHRAIRGWFQQRDYVTDASGALRCDVLRFEHHTTDVTRYFALRQPLQVRNVSNGEALGTEIVRRRDYRAFYGDEERRIVGEWYAEDIEFFGFTFDGTATRNTWCARTS